MARYQVVTIKDDGTISKRRTSQDHPEGANIVIAFALTAKHDIALVKALELVDRGASVFGRQVAFVDDDCTFVVTRID